MSFTFGIYPGAALGGDGGLLEPTSPDDPDQINRALDDLQGDTPFLVRAYLPFRPPVGSGERPTPTAPEKLLQNGRRLELVLGYRADDLEGWLTFIRDTITAHAERIALLQICEEPNADLPYLDGRTPNVRHALIQGVMTAREHADRLSLDLAVGFNAVPTIGPDLSFWQDLAALAAERSAHAGGSPDVPPAASTSDSRPAAHLVAAGQALSPFHQSLAYVGLDFFPDVFRPIPPPDLAEAVAALLADFRHRVLPAAGVGPATPIRITEHGWPTGPERSEQRQAEVLQTVLDTVLGLSASLNITGYSHFALRDAGSAASAGPSLFHHFGLLRGDYSPKPAFAVYRRACLGGLPAHAPG